jgi:hypothetical protein
LPTARRPRRRGARPGSGRGRPDRPSAAAFLRAKLIEAGFAGETANLEQEIARTARLPQPILERQRIVIAMHGEAAILSHAESSPDHPGGRIE